MANIIPEAMYDDITSRSRGRFILAASTVALICAALAALALLPSYLVLTTSIAGSSGTVPITPAQSATDRASIQNANALIGEVSALSATSTATAAISEALSLRPSGVRIDQISYVAGSPASLMLVGSSDTTSGISAYRAALAADALFSSVSVPVGALVGSDGGRFSISLSGTF